MSTQTQGCCAFEGGFKCTVIWCISLSAVGLLFSLCSAGFWAWPTSLITIILFSAVGCTPARTGRILAAVGAGLSFLTFILQVTVSSIIISQGSIYCTQPTTSTYWPDDDYINNYNDNYLYDSCKTVSTVLGSIGIIGALLWLSASIVGAVLTYKMFTVDMGDGGAAHVAGTKQENAPDIEVASAMPGTTSIVEKTMPDGTQIIEKTVIDPMGNATVTVTTHEPVMDA